MSGVDDFEVPVANDEERDDEDDELLFGGIDEVVIPATGRVGEELFELVGGIMLVPEVVESGDDVAGFSSGGGGNPLDSGIVLLIGD